MNIAEILKDKPRGTKLYSPLFGKCSLEQVDEHRTFPITAVDNKLLFITFTQSGQYLNIPAGECMIFPSKEMRDWNKFAWKKGDVLVNLSGNIECVFKEYIDDTYKTFTGVHCFNSDPDDNEYIPETMFSTNAFKLQDLKLIPCYINTIEERFNGKLNLETLEIEPAQPEFKDGNIAFADYGNRQNVFIVSDKTVLLEGYSSFIVLDLRGLTLSMGCKMNFYKKDLCKLRLATEEEKQQLFEALVKKNKRWDAEKKRIINLKPNDTNKPIEPKYSFKPFDKVLVRDSDDEKWSCDFFSYMEDDEAICTGTYWLQCLPYNEETAKLIGTTKSLEDIR